MRSQAPSQLSQLQEGLRRLRECRTRELVLLASAWLCLGSLSLLLILGAIDCLYPFGGMLRLSIFIFFVLYFAVSLLWLIRLHRQRPSDEAMAVLVEKALPSAENRLINAVQLGSAHAPAGFLEALLTERPIRLYQVLPSSLYSPTPRLWLKRILLPLLLLWCILFAVFPRGICTSLARLLLPFGEIAPYSATRIASLSPGNIVLKRGDALETLLTLTGKTVSNATLMLDDGNGKPEHFAMERQDGTRFRFRTRPLYSSIRYRVLAGDAVSEWKTARIAPMPGLAHWEAKLTPPPHTGLSAATLRSDMDKLELYRHSVLDFTGSATIPLATLQVAQGDKILAEITPHSREFQLKAEIPGDGPVRFLLTSTEGVNAEVPLPFQFLIDHAPAIRLVDTPVKLTASRGASLPIVFLATDDFGLQRVGLERLPDDFAKNEQISVVTPPSRTASFPGRFVVDMASFDASLENLRFRLWAEDNSPEHRRAFSTVFQIDFPKEEETKAARNTAKEQLQASLDTIIKKQRNNLKDTRQATELLASQQPLPQKRLEILNSTQKEIREESIALLKPPLLLPGILETMTTLVNGDMKLALEEFALVFRSPPAERQGSLQECLRLETAILAALTNMKEILPSEQKQQERADIFAALQKLVKQQRTNLKETENALGGQAVSGSALVHIQDTIAQAVLAFTRQCQAQATQRSEDDFAALLRKAQDLLDKEQAYEVALGAAEELDAKEYKEAAASERKVLKTLLQTLDFLNQWRVQNAKDILKGASEVLSDLKLKLDEMEKTQARVAEVTRDLKKRGPLDDEAREKLAELDKEQEALKDMAEQLANDLYQFPELPICNELNSKMREIYEDVLQALGSADLPSVEIAVQKEDALLDAIRSTQKRIEDVEMWMPDVPDHFVWNMESFDTDEFPEIPLVPLPDELEDIVGELLDQADSIDAQSQDTTGNNIVADAEMGWAIMDGPMPSFSAKGKTGNTRPNDNEMTGRSGAGREGQATGELVENHVNGYEGRETHARRTGDQFQKGMVTEDEESTLKARATGGGKLGGTSESIGMFGNAPRRDLHTAAHGTSPQKLRQETEVLYASARLLYLGSGALAETARELRTAENKPPELQDFGGLRRRVMRRLEDTQVALKDGAVLSMPVAPVSQTSGGAVSDSEMEHLSDEYKALLTEYYKSLAQ